MGKWQEARDLSAAEKEYRRATLAGLDAGCVFPDPEGKNYSQLQSTAVRFLTKDELGERIRSAAKVSADFLRDIITIREQEEREEE